jgi:hypothetical protein
MAKKPVTPIPVIGAVPPRRKPNAELRSGEYLLTFGNGFRSHRRMHGTHFVFGAANQLNQ